MAPNLPKDYKVGIFESKGAPITFKQVPLELPKAGEVRAMHFGLILRKSLISA
jgi:hypothetical protein